MRIRRGVALVALALLAQPLWAADAIGVDPAFDAAVTASRAAMMR